MIDQAVDFIGEAKSRKETALISREKKNKRKERGKKLKARKGEKREHKQC